MPAPSSNEQLVEFLVREADRGAPPGQPEAVPDWLDDNFWGRLADGLVGPAERHRLQDLLVSNPYVRRRAAEIARDWPEALVGRETIGPRRAWRTWRRVGYALAAGVLVATGVVVSLLFQPAPAPGPGVPADAIASAQEALEQGRYGQARQLAERLLADPESSADIRKQAGALVAATYFRRSRQLLDQGKYDQAAAEARAGIEAGHDSVGLRHVLVCGELRGPLALAMADSDVVPGPVAHRKIATTAPSVDWPRVIDACEAAVNRHADSSALWARLGRAYLGSRKYGKAVDALKKSLALDATDAAVHTWLGLTYYAQDNYIEAAKSFEAALGLAPGKALLHYNLGRAYENGEDDEGNQKLGLSLAHYERFLKLAPESPLAADVRPVVSQLRRHGVKPVELD